MKDVRAYIKERVAVEDRGYSTPCWIWQLSLNHNGYAQGRAPGYPTVWLIHRVSHVEFVGAIPAGLCIDHLCRNRNCVNPEHLEPVTNRENTLRGKSSVPGTHCRRGHEMTRENSMYDRHGRTRTCRICHNDWARNVAYPRRKARKAAAARMEGGVSDANGGGLTRHDRAVDNS